MLVQMLGGDVMRMTRLVPAIGIVSALLLAGGITAGLIMASDQAPPAVPTLPETVIPVSDSVVATQPREWAPAQSRGQAPPLPEPVVMPEPDIEATPETRIVRPSEGGASSEQESANPGTVYTYQDGDRTMRVVLQSRQAARDTVAAATEDGAAENGELGSNTRKRSEPDSGQPVFRSESGGGLMTLPGGIILALDPEWDRAAVEEFFSQNGISLERTSELDFLDNGFFVETEPGFPSLELANALADQEGVILSSPNWAREAELR